MRSPTMRITVRCLKRVRIRLARRIPLAMKTPECLHGFSYSAEVTACATVIDHPQPLQNLAICRNPGSDLQELFVALIFFDSDVCCCVSIQVRSGVSGTRSSSFTSRRVSLIRNHIGERLLEHHVDTVVVFAQFKSPADG